MKEPPPFFRGEFFIPGKPIDFRPPCHPYVSTIIWGPPWVSFSFPMNLPSLTSWQGTWMSQEVDGSMVWINGLFHLLINGIYIRFYIPPDPITFDPSTSRDPGHLIYHPEADVHFSRQTQEEIVARMLLPRKFLSQISGSTLRCFQNITLPTTSQKIPKYQRSAGSSEVFNGISFGLAKRSRNGWWLVEFQPV